tara:strand:- start:215 stop:418 length:204 start_codon:yes stop_codon:yes gene_type:complete
VPVFLRPEKSRTDRASYIYDTNDPETKSKPLVIRAADIGNKSAQIRAPTNNTYGFEAQKNPIIESGF